MEALLPWVGPLLIAILVFSLNYLKDTFNSLSKSVKQLTVAVVELKVELRNVKEKLDEFPKMKKDIDAFHVKIRDIQKKDI